VGKEQKGVDNETRYIPSNYGNHQICCCVLLYLHPGGYETGAPEDGHGLFTRLLSRHDMVVFAPAYRLSLEHPYPTSIDDAYATLLYMKEHAR